MQQITAHNPSITSVIIIIIFIMPSKAVSKMTRNTHNTEHYNTKILKHILKYYTYMYDCENLPELATNANCRL